MCDCVEAILVPSGDRIKDLVDEIFEVPIMYRFVFIVSVFIVLWVYIATCVCSYTM